MKAGEWWPSTTTTCLAFQPERKSIEAQVWRSVWKPAHGTPARRTAGLSMRFRRASPLSGVPTLLGKTGASSGGAPEAARWRQGSCARTVEIGTSRMPHPMPEDTDVRTVILAGG